MKSYSEVLEELHALKIKDAQQHKREERNTGNKRGGERMEAFGGHTYTVESVRRELGLDGWSDAAIAEIIEQDAGWRADDNIKKANALQVTIANNALADSQRQLDAARNAAARVVTPPLFTPLVVKPNIFTDPYYGYRPIVQAPVVHKHYARAPPASRARSPSTSDRKEKERKERERSRERLQREKEKLQREREKAKEKLQRERDRSRERMKKEKARNKK